MCAGGHSAGYHTLGEPSVDLRINRVIVGSLLVYRHADSLRGRATHRHCETQARLRRTGEGGQRGGDRGVRLVGAAHRVHILWRSVTVRRPATPGCSGGQRDRYGLPANRSAPRRRAAGDKKSYFSGIWMPEQQHIGMRKIWPARKPGSTRQWLCRGTSGRRHGLRAKRPEAPAQAAMLLLPALNEMIDITTTRAVATQNHPPFVVFYCCSPGWVSSARCWLDTAHHPTRTGAGSTR